MRFQKNKEKNALLNEFSEQDKYLEKQKQLEVLMELMTEEMRELLTKWNPYGGNED